MIKNKGSYNSFKLLRSQRLWIVFCFLLFVVVQPIANMTTFLVQAKYEFSEILSNENTQGQQDLNEDDDNEKFHYSIVRMNDIYLNRSPSYFNIQKYALRYKPDIHLPPPRL